jgi:stress-induced morphogen
VPLTTVLQPVDRVLTFFWRQAKASLPPGDTPEHFDMKSLRQFARSALCCSAESWAAATPGKVSEIAAAANTTAKRVCVVPKVFPLFSGIDCDVLPPGAKTVSSHNDGINGQNRIVMGRDGVHIPSVERFCQMPMDAGEIERLIKASIPDANVTIRDLAGDGDHYAATVIAASFKGKSRVQQHQLVYNALKGQMGGVLHALALQTGTPY